MAHLLSSSFLLMFPFCVCLNGKPFIIVIGGVIMDDDSISHILFLLLEKKALLVLQFHLSSFWQLGLGILP